MDSLGYKSGSLLNETGLYYSNDDINNFHDTVNHTGNLNKNARPQSAPSRRFVSAQLSPQRFPSEDAGFSPASPYDEEICFNNDDEEDLDTIEIKQTQEDNEKLFNKIIEQSSQIETSKTTLARKRSTSPIPTKSSPNKSGEISKSKNTKRNSTNRFLVNSSKGLVSDSQLQAFLPQVESLIRDVVRKTDMYHTVQVFSQ